MAAELSAALASMFLWLNNFRHFFYLWESLKNRACKTNHHFVEELGRNTRAYSLTISFARTPDTCCAAIHSACGKEGKISTCDVALDIFLDFLEVIVTAIRLYVTSPTVTPFDSGVWRKASQAATCRFSVKKKMVHFVHLRSHFNEWVWNIAGVILTG